MSALERPRLRSHLAAAADGRGHYIVWDQLHLDPRQLRVAGREMTWLRLLDGQRSLAELHAEIAPAPLEAFNQLLHALDDVLFLEGPRFRSRLQERANDPIRPPSCTASYGDDPALVRRSLERLFTQPGGPGRPGPRRPDPSFRAALIPHIDYGRGGIGYAWAYKEVYERTPAALFVIIATSHYSPHRFTLTRKNFQTPLGIIPTDQSYVERLTAHYGDGLFDDEFAAHAPEHSIELEVVFLQFLHANTPFRIVPLLVGSFHDCIESGRVPSEANDIGRMITALRAVERETTEPICYVISGDLAHVGPKFGDPQPVSPAFLTHSQRQDQLLLRELGNGKDGVRRSTPPDPNAYFNVIAAEGDQRRICGLPPTYLTLEALLPRRGEMLHYDQYVHPEGFESVSFASMAFYK